MGTFTELSGQVVGRQIVAGGHARSVRLSAGLSLTDLADVVGCTAAACSLWESGKRRPSGDVGRRYLAALAQLVDSGRLT